MSSNPEVQAIAPDVAPATPVLDAIRSATRRLHRQLDASLMLTRSPPSRALYLRHIAAMTGWMAPLEARLRGYPWPAALEPETRLRKTDALVSDLIAGGWSSDAIGALPHCDHLPALDPPARRYGALYVVEGSTLGGRVLARRFARPLEGWPLAALTGYGRATGRMWRIFTATLEQVGAAPGFPAEAARGAAATFRSLLDWMRSTGAACPAR